MTKVAEVHLTVHFATQCARGSIVRLDRLLPLRRHGGERRLPHNATQCARGSIVFLLFIFLARTAV